MATPEPRWTMDRDVKASQRLLAEGNAAYLAGQLSRALLLYKQSADAAPDDAVFLSTLSDACFESGDYGASLRLADQSLVLTKEPSKRQKLYQCKSKSLIYLLDHESAAKTVQLLERSAEKAELEHALQNSRHNCHESDQDDDLAKIARARLIIELPRYKGRIRSIPPFLAVGHGVPESLFDPTLLDTGREKVSLLFAGISDARHLHKTILSAGFDQAARDRFFDFTIVDHKAAVIARNILILLMIYEFSQILDDDEKKATSLIFPLFYYTYLAPIMPALLHDVLQTKIGQAITLLEQPTLMPDFLDVPIACRGEVQRILIEWQEEVGLAYPTRTARDEVVHQRGDWRRRRFYAAERRKNILTAPAGCAKEQAFYEEFGILTMNWASHEMFYEEELQQAFADFDVENRGDTDLPDFLDVVVRNWKTNPTFIDLEWERNRKYSYEYLLLNHDPFEFGHDLLKTGAEAPEEQGLLNIVSFWFNGVCHGFSRISERCNIHACVGDVESFLEQARFNVGGRPTAPARFNNPTNSRHPAINENSRPPAYDRIHLSNIPDYIGGSLSVYLYAMPALHPGVSSYVTSTCLRSSSQWDHKKHIDNEYIAVNDTTELEQLFLACRKPFEPMEEKSSSTQYAKWLPQLVHKSHQNLLPRPKLETWLYRLFLRMTLPVGREVSASALSGSPMNLTAFLRVCAHLYSVGYPAHWISGVLNDLVSGSIYTSARPPRNVLLGTKEHAEQVPMLKQSTKPFVAELTTLLSLWRVVLPFGLLSGDIPSARKVHMFELNFPDCEGFWGEAPVFILVLFKVKVLRDEARKSLRPVLMSDEFTHSSTKVKNVRDTAIHIISTWKWNEFTETATFWLRVDLLSSLNKSDWGISIWRTDTWGMHTDPRDLGEIRDMGRF